MGKIITNVKNKIVKRNDSSEDIEFQKYNIAGQRTGRRSVIGRSKTFGILVKMHLPVTFRQ